MPFQRGFSAHSLASAKVGCEPVSCLMAACGVMILSLFFSRTLYESLFPSSIADFLQCGKNFTACKRGESSNFGAKCGIFTPKLAQIRPFWCAPGLRFTQEQIRA